MGVKKKVNRFALKVSGESGGFGAGGAGGTARQEGESGNEEKSIFLLR